MTNSIVASSSAEFLSLEFPCARPCAGGMYDLSVRRHTLYTDNETECDPMRPACQAGQPIRMPQTQK